MCNSFERVRRCDGTAIRREGNQDVCASTCNSGKGDLAAPEPTFIVGTEIIVDGGMSQL
jgi:hypothetical protein